jgi:ferritin
VDKEEYKHGFNKIFRILYPAKSGKSEGDKMKTFMEVYVEVKKEEMKTFQDIYEFEDLVEELFEMLLTTDKGMHELRDRE